VQLYGDKNSPIDHATFNDARVISETLNVDTDGSFFIHTFTITINVKRNTEVSHAAVNLYAFRCNLQKQFRGKIVIYFEY